jgi:hypothetical protein
MLLDKYSSCNEATVVSGSVVMNGPVPLKQEMGTRLDIERLVAASPCFMVVTNCCATNSCIAAGSLEASRAFLSAL